MATIGSRLKKAAKKVADKARDIAGNVALTPVLPLLPAMKLLLKKKGIKSGDLEDTTRKFFAMITARNYEDVNFFDYEGLENFDDLGNFSEERKAEIIERRAYEQNFQAQFSADNFEDDHFIDPVTAGAAAKGLVEIVKAIVQFFKDKKRAKEQGVELRPEEKEALKKVDDAANIMVNDKKPTEAGLGGNGDIFKYVLIGAAALILINLAVKK